MKQSIAVLITCHNRKAKTLACLDALYNANLPDNLEIDVFLVDDGSTDGTYEAIKSMFSDVNLIKGSGNLFWAGGMRLAWETALKNHDFNYFLLLNDDVILFPDYFSNIQLIINTPNSDNSLYSAATIDQETNEITYGALKVKRKYPFPKYEKLYPNGQLQECDMTNANILLVSCKITKTIGILDSRYTHGIADYDYSLRARKAGFSAYLLPKVHGFCSDDHGNNWAPSSHSIKQRIQYLKSPKGLAYKEYLFYIKRHFPLYLPIAFCLLWLKTFFPSLWNKLK